MPPHTYELARQQRLELKEAGVGFFLCAKYRAAKTTCKGSQMDLQTTPQQAWSRPDGPGPVVR